MKITIQDYNDVMVVELQGELDGDFANLFQDNITDIVTRNRDKIVLDMSQIGFIDSQGLERLVWAANYCRENKCQLKLAGLDENCEKILEITRLENQFERHDELAKAVKSFV